jgi:hypothetical protein
LQLENQFIQGFQIHDFDHVLTNVFTPNFGPIEKTLGMPELLSACASWDM